MNLTDILTCTRVASWSDRKSHRQRLEKLLGVQALVSIRKAYVLGHATADSQTIARIDYCNKAKKCIEPASGIPGLTLWGR